MSLHCPNCKREVKETEKFCYNCGTQLEKKIKIICLQCGKELSSYEKFCTECGRERPNENRV